MSGVPTPSKCEPNDKSLASSLRYVSVTSVGVLGDRSEHPPGSPQRQAVKEARDAGGDNFRHDLLTSLRIACLLRFRVG